MKDRLTRVTFTTEELRKLPRTHSGFFVSSCLAINEIGLTLRLFLMCLNTRSKKRPISDGPLEEYAFAQFQMLERTLGSKCLEYLNMLGNYQTRYQRKNDTTVAQLIDPIMLHVRDSIRIGPEYELALWYRNHATFHFNVSEITNQLMTSDIADEHNIYLHEHSGNASYVIGEKFLLGKLAEGGKDTRETADALAAYGKWVEDTARYVVDVHHRFSVFFLKAFFPEKVGHEFKISPEPHLVARVDETALPILWDFTGIPSSMP